jgi:hypothetical protein
MKGQGNKSQEFLVCDGNLTEPVQIKGKQVTKVPLRLSVSYNMLVDSRKTRMLTRVVADCTNQDLQDMDSKEVETHAPHFRIDVPRGEVKIAGFPVQLPAFNITRSIKKPVDLTSVVVRVLINPRTQRLLGAGAVLSLMALAVWIWTSRFGYVPEPFPRIFIVWPEDLPGLIRNLPGIPGIRGNLPSTELPPDLPLVTPDLQLLPTDGPPGL